MIFTLSLPQFSAPMSGPTESRTWCVFNLFDTMVVFLRKWKCENGDIEQKSFFKYKKK